jgi:hypothetical protein
MLLCHKLDTSTSVILAGCIFRSVCALITLLVGSRSIACGQQLRHDVGTDYGEAHYPAHIRTFSVLTSTGITCPHRPESAAEKQIANETPPNTG